MQGAGSLSRMSEKRQGLNTADTFSPSSIPDAKPPRPAPAQPLTPCDPAELQWPRRIQSHPNNPRPGWGDRESG